ncbi:MAG TPA: class I SAM-dependent methyltransferase [Bacteroidia bacterium]|jgi:hypothetical protein|nr:class I SAM-dependent methyltransferase [Bacteroidia bacterium]
MAGLNRKPLQGLFNIIRFNRHWYLLAAGVVGLIVWGMPYLPYALRMPAMVGLELTIGVMVLSLFVSWYIYDYSDLYAFTWLNQFPSGTVNRIINIHAGFDESSPVLEHHFPASNLLVLDFYDATKHPEISVERARKAYPAYPGTRHVQTNSMSLNKGETDLIFLILAAHEIRNTKERVEFFKQLAAALKPGGRIVVLEHQRDWTNLLAYNIGAFHFLSRNTWLYTFKEAGLCIGKEWKQTPFITGFILKQDGIAS